MSGRKENKWLNSDDLWEMGLPDRWAYHTFTFPFGYFCITWLFFKERIHLFYDLITFLSIYYSNTWKFITFKMFNWDSKIQMGMVQSQGSLL